MVELRDQCALAFFCMLALSHVDIDAYHSFRTPFCIVRNRAASFDPTDFARWEDYAALSGVFLPPVDKSSLTRPFRPLKILVCTLARHSQYDVSVVPSGKPWIAA